MDEIHNMKIFKGKYIVIGKGHIEFTNIITIFSAISTDLKKWNLYYDHRFIQPFNKTFSTSDFSASENILSMAIIIKYNVSNIYYSIDGINWDFIYSSKDNNVIKSVYGNDRFVYLIDSLRSRHVISLVYDFKNWKTCDYDLGFPHFRMNMVYDNVGGQFIVIMTDGNYAYSKDGCVWKSERVANTYFDIYAIDTSPSQTIVAGIRGLSFFLN